MARRLRRGPHLAGVPGNFQPRWGPLHRIGADSDSTGASAHRLGSHARRAKRGRPGVDSPTWGWGMEIGPPPVGLGDSHEALGGGREWAFLIPNS